MSVVPVSAACSLWPPTRSRRSVLRAPPCFLVSGLEVPGGRRPRSRRRGPLGALRGATPRPMTSQESSPRAEILNEVSLVWAPRFPRACDLGRTVERRLAWRRGRRLRRSHRRAPNRELPLIRFRATWVKTGRQQLTPTRALSRRRSAARRSVTSQESPPPADTYTTPARSQIIGHARRYLILGGRRSSRGLAWRPGGAAAGAPVLPRRPPQGSQEL